MPTILLVRHGQGSFGTADYDVLTERGAVQATAVHAALHERGVKADRLVSGSLRRQRDTALPWTSAGELEIDPRWNEYDSDDILGAHSNVPASLEHRPGDDAPKQSTRDFQAVLEAALLDWIAAGAASPAAETWDVFRDRVAAALSDVALTLGSGETAIVFTSGGVIAACAVALFDLPESALVTFNRVSVNGSITKLVHGRRGTTLISYNEHAHLEPRGLVTYR